MFYPIMLDISKKNIIIIGGGKVAYRKSKKILEFEGNLIILSPEIIEEFNELKNLYKDKINFIYDRYHIKYIKDAFLVIGATSSRRTNEVIKNDCDKLKILVNIVDSKEASDFITPSVINNDNLTISISTMGSFPYLSKRIRKDMEKNYGKFNKEYIDTLEEIRFFILNKKPDKIRGEMERILDLDIDELKEELEKYKNDL